MAKEALSSSFQKRLQGRHPGINIRPLVRKAPRNGAGKRLARRLARINSTRKSEPPRIKNFSKMID
ncbi:hypothetical protein CNECB9_5230004 [Cupriavidus necator]|uniref:Uncharacterized protein n=1 Tax=Cupriavidus necator TaxID=106590 RepID=A0A1K0IP26_CUPNE|nr:hypothetical protein CNECB9_5230004 [Cupriavidus necator]